MLISDNSLVKKNYFLIEYIFMIIFTSATSILLLHIYITLTRNHLPAGNISYWVRSTLMGCPPVRGLIHSLKLVDYLLVQADKPLYLLYVHHSAKPSMFPHILWQLSRVMAQNECLACIDILTVSEKTYDIAPFGWWVSWKQEKKKCFRLSRVMHQS